MAKSNSKTKQQKARQNKMIALVVLWFLFCPLLYFVLMALHIDIILAIYIVVTFMSIAGALVPILINVILRGRPDTKAERDRRRRYFGVSKVMFLFILPLAITLLVSLAQFLLI
ncbi:hypothetical protein [Candidatus Soleaferrea massiliensis]|uniref:hypothetical protein n=1 Tax=Candidatus Soleaferrea massiliensis TaxID=1470354 RepID=UPI00058C3F2D|nr:hypothetical protein [Candidatus Soleaferrea massiliensis]